QTVHDHGKGAVPVDLDERAGVRHRKIQRFSIRVERAEREGVKGATQAKLQVKHPGGAGGYLRSGGRFRPERHNLAGLGRVGVGATLGHEDGVAEHHQPGRDDVVEVDEHGDLAVEGDPQHAVEVRIGDQEAAAIFFYRELESGREVEVERDGRRIEHVELADVSDDSETRRAVHSVDADNVGAAGVQGDGSDQCVSGLADERDVDYPTITNAEESGWQTAGERRDLPGF